MDRVTFDSVLMNISLHLHLSAETEHEILAEIRAHLEDAVAAAAASGADEHSALLKAAEAFGMDETSAQLSEIHTHREALYAIIGTAVPVLFALALRWLTFAPDGSPANWPQLLEQPGFYLLAAAALVFPILALRRWRFALVGWAFFWLITVIFVLFPSKHW